MYTLLSLISRVNDFYKQATALEKLADAKSDPLYNKLVTTIPRIRDTALKSEVAFISYLFKKALDQNGGYGIVYDKACTVQDEIDEEESNEAEAVNDLIEELLVDLDERKKTSPDTPENTATIKKSIKALKEAGIKSEQETVGESVMDPTGGVGIEGNKGQSFTTKTFKDWASTYDTEIKRYTNDLVSVQDLKKNIPSKTRISVIENINKLIPLLESMKKLTAEAFQKELEVDDPKSQARLQEIVQELKDKQKQRLTLKLYLRNFRLGEQVNNLHKDLESAEGNEKELINEKIELINLQKSRATNIKPEVAARKAYIDFLEAGKGVTEETKRNYKHAILEAHKNTITSEQINRMKTEQQAKQRGIDPENVRSKLEQPEGYSIKRWNYDKENFNSSLITLRFSINTSRNEAKKAIIKKLVGEAHTQGELKLIMDRATKAYTNGNNEAYAAAAKDLTAKMKLLADAELRARLSNYKWTVAFSNIAMDIRDHMEKISPWMEEPELNDQQKFVMSSLAQKSDNFVKFLNKHKLRISKKSSDQLYLNSTIKGIEGLSGQIKMKLGSDHE